MMIFIALLYVVCFIATAVYFARREGYLSIVPVFGLSAFYYYVAIPLELSLTGQTHVRTTTWMYYTLYSEDCVRVGFMALLALIGFSVGYRCSGFTLDKQTSAARLGVTIPKPIVWMAVAAVSIIFMQYGLSLFSILSNYREGSELRHGNPLLSAMLQYTVLAMAIVASVLCQGTKVQRLLGYSLAGCLAIWGIFTLDKDPICQAVFAVAAGFVGQRSRSIGAFAAVTLGFTVAVMGLPVFSTFRANADVNLREILGRFTVLETDARGPLASLSIEMADNRPSQYGATYPLAAVCLLPRVIYPNRPPDLAEQLAIDNIPAEHWYGGIGMGYCLMAEAYVNFGVLGGFLQYLLIGFVFGKTLVGAQKLLHKEPNDAFLRAMYSCTGLMCVLIMHRGPTNQIGRMLIYYGVVPMCVFVVLNLSPIENFLSESQKNREQKHPHAMAP